jgi:hypothetical protein
VNRAAARIWNNPERLLWWTLEELYGGDIRKLDFEDAIEIMEQHSAHRRFQVALRRRVRRRRGRPRGSEPGLAEARAEVRRVREIWKRAFGRYYRKASPTAVEIAAWRHDFDPERITNYAKNLSRRRS